MTAKSQRLPMSTNAKPETTPPPLPIGAAMRWSIIARELPAHLGDCLEIGCGQGAFSWRLSERANHLTSIEPDQTSFERAAARLNGLAKVQNIDDSALPKDASFDTVCAFEVLEHIEDDSAILARWAKRVKAGGILALSVPAHSHRLGAWDELVGHYRRYDKGDLANRLIALGFSQVREVRYGFPIGYALEEARNFIARRRLQGGQHQDEYAERTASSGRILQPEGMLVNTALKAGGKLASWVQSAFPDRGQAMVVIAKRSW